jgi:hypothetical protein
MSEANRAETWSRVWDAQPLGITDPRTDAIWCAAEAATDDLGRPAAVFGVGGSPEWKARALAHLEGLLSDRKLSKEHRAWFVALGVMW